MKKMNLSFPLLLGIGGLLFSLTLQAEDIRATLTHTDLTPGQSDTFSLSRSTGTAGSCSGTMTENFSGVTTLSASSCDGAYSGQAGTRHGFRFDNFHIFRSFLNSNQVVTAASSPACPASNMTYNYLLIRGRSPTDYGSDAMDLSLESSLVGGVLNYNTSSSSFQSSSYFGLQNPTPGTASFNLNSYKSSSCNSGSLRTESNHSSIKPLDKFGTWTFGTSSALYTSVGGNPRVALAVPQVALSSATQAAKAGSTYTGLFQGFNSKGNQSQEVVYAAPDAAGTTFSLYLARRNANNSNLPTLNNSDEKDSFGSINCTNLNSPAPGFCQGTITLDSAPGKTGNAVCLFAYGVNQKDLLFCNAQKPSSNNALHNKSLITFIAGTTVRSVIALTAADSLQLPGGTSSGDYTVTVTNLTPRATTLSLSTPPTAPLSQPASLNGNSASTGFSSSGACGTTLPAFSSCTVTVTYSPATQRVDADYFRLSYLTGLPAPNEQLNATVFLRASRGLSSIRISAPSFNVGSSGKASVFGIFEDGTTQDISPVTNSLTSSFTSSTNPQFTLSPTGNLTSTEPGTSTVSAVFGDKTASGTARANVTWVPTSIPTISGGRNSDSAVWTGSKMIIWGGPDNTGVLYDPTTDSWSAMSGTNAPEYRFSHMTLWTGTKMIIWGGNSSPGISLNTGSSYDPASDSWTEISTTDAPTPRYNASAIWTGSKMIIWGGVQGISISLNTGGIYDPLSDSWNAVTTTNAPTARRKHSAVWTGTKMIIWGGRGNAASQTYNTGAIYDPAADSWTAISTTNAPSARTDQLAVWTGSKMIVWGGFSISSYFNTGGIFDPASDSWAATSVGAGVPEARRYHSAIWTDSRMIIWGGGNGITTLNSGGIYNPASDSWAATSTDTNVPTARQNHSAIWTGSKMIVWGGLSDSATGGVYSPEGILVSNPTRSDAKINSNSSVTLSWDAFGADISGYTIAYKTGSTPPSTCEAGSGVTVLTPSGLSTNATIAASEFVADTDYSFRVCSRDPAGNLSVGSTGGFRRDSFSNPSNFAGFVSGNEVSLSWTAPTEGSIPGYVITYQEGNTPPASCDVGRLLGKYPSGTTTTTTLIEYSTFSLRLCTAPPNRWTTSSGATLTLTTLAMNPDSWVSTSPISAPSGRTNHTAVWTGSKMIVWGGYTTAVANTGGLYDPVTDSWTATSTTNAPASRRYHSAVWTGSKMIIWGGYTTAVANTGGLYDPATNSWTATSTTNAPAARQYHSAIWTGSKMIIWGGYTTAVANTGGLYDPATNSWTATSTTNAPAARQNHSAIWTGSKMIVWAGSTTAVVNTGGLYDPASDSWSTTSTGTNVPASRQSHSAVWTGSKMIIWGGPDNTGGVYLPTGILVPNPTQVIATAASSTSVSLSWSGLGSTITGYKVAYKSGSVSPTSCLAASGVTLLDFPSSPANTTVSSLTTNSYYSFRVCSVNANNEISPGETTSTYVMSNSEIAGFSSSSSYNQVSLTWSAPSDGNPLSYLITYQEGSSPPDSCSLGNQLGIFSGTSTSTSSYLGANKTYSFRICKRTLDQLSTGLTTTVTTGDQSPDSWLAMATTNAPANRASHSAVWTGSKMIVWGGNSNTGGVYDPATDSWTATSTTNAPSSRTSNAALWTGSKMIIWGGGGANTGGIYDPANDTWAPTSTTNAPPGRSDFFAVWTGARMLVWGGSPSSSVGTSGGIYDPTSDTWTTMSITNAPEARYLYSTGREHTHGVWTGSKFLVWGGWNSRWYINTGGVYDPLTNTWTPTSTTNRPWGNSWGAFGASYVWTGSKMIVWGGIIAGVVTSKIGGLYDPVTDSWSATSTGANCATERWLHTATWTGSKMLVWGGTTLYSGGTPTNTGGSYDPATDSWTALSTNGGVEARQCHTAVWTGSKLLVWGGSGTTTTSSGWIYKPAGSNITEPTHLMARANSSTQVGLSWEGLGADIAGYTIAYQSGQSAPLNCSAAVGVTILSPAGTGTTATVSSLNTNTYYSFRVCSRNAAGTLSGGITAGVALADLTEASNLTASVSGSQITLSWTAPVTGALGYFISYQQGATAPANCSSGTFWLGYPGATTSAVVSLPENLSYSFRLCTRGMYASSQGITVSASTGNMSAGTWAATSTTNAPSARIDHSAIWTGSKMIVWGGNYSNTGGIYDPATDSWTATSTTNVPSGRSQHTAVWTGSKMIVWGGGTNTGGVYDPSTDTWTATSTTNAPSSRSNHIAVWTGSKMIVWGGGANTGGIYDLTNDSWIITSTTNAPAARTNCTAVWTGSKMIVWGGSGAVTNTGGQYDPSTDTWTATSTGANCPAARYGHSSVWTGSKMLIWGGWNDTSRLNTGGQYDPSTDTWTAITTTGAPSARSHTATVWSGSVMIVWGGVGSSGTYGEPGLKTGGVYNPTTNSWTATSSTNAPVERIYPKAVWAGNKMILWGGKQDSTGEIYNTGALYSPP